MCILRKEWSYLRQNKWKVITGFFPFLARIILRTSFIKKSSPRLLDDLIPVIPKNCSHFFIFIPFHLIMEHYHPCGVFRIRQWFYSCRLFFRSEVGAWWIIYSFLPCAHSIFMCVSLLQVWVTFVSAQVVVHALSTGTAYRKDILHPLSGIQANNRSIHWYHACHKTKAGRDFRFADQQDLRWR